MEIEIVSNLNRWGRNLFYSRFPFLPLILLLLASFLAYLPSFGNNFCLDDWVIENAHYPRTLCDSHFLLVEPVDHGSILIYRPLTFFSFTWDQVVWGKKLAGWHLTNILLHAAVSMTLFFIFLHFLSPYSAFFTSLLFVVHPGHCEAVVSVYNRSQILSNLGIYLALLCLLHAFESGRIRWIFTSSILVFLGCLAKESALITPLLSFLFLLYVWQSETKPKLAKRWILASVFAQAIFCLLYMGFRWHTLRNLHFSKESAFLQNASFWQHYSTMCDLLGMYAGKAFLPIVLSCDYTEISRLPIIAYCLLPLVFAFSFYGILWARQQAQKIVSFCFLWFFLALIPVLHFLPLPIPFAERLLYPASPAIVFFLAWFFFLFSKKIRILSWLLVLGMMLTTMNRCLDWKDNSTLWKQELKRKDNKGNYQSYRACIYFGSESAKNAIQAKEKKEKVQWYQMAFDYYYHALSLKPNSYNKALIYHNLGILYETLGMQRESQEHFSAALKAYPQHALTLVVLGDIAWEQKRWKEACEFYRKIPWPVNRWDKRHEEIQKKLKSCHFR